MRKTIMCHMKLQRWLFFSVPRLGNIRGNLVIKRLFLHRSVLLLQCWLSSLIVPVLWWCSLKLGLPLEQRGEKKERKIMGFPLMSFIDQCLFPTSSRQRDFLSGSWASALPPWPLSTAGLRSLAGVGLRGGPGQRKERRWGRGRGGWSCYW